MTRNALVKPESVQRLPAHWADDLTGRQRRLVETIVEESYDSLKAAAIAVGYAPETIKSTLYTALSKNKVRRAIQACREENEQKRLDLRKDGERLLSTSIDKIDSPRDKAALGLQMVKTAAEGLDKASAGDFGNADDVAAARAQWDQMRYRRTYHGLRLALKYPGRARRYLDTVRSLIK
jgi:DNA-binding CsgD family transcriptional regulator